MAEVSFKISQVKLFYIIKLEIEGRIVEVEGKQDELFKSESADSACWRQIDWIDHEVNQEGLEAAVAL